ncbi:MAG: sigma-54 dependent transcriptional regulator [Fibrobacterota bacterium]
MDENGEILYCHNQEFHKKSFFVSQLTGKNIGDLFNLNGEHSLRRLRDNHPETVRSLESFSFEPRTPMNPAPSFASNRICDDRVIPKGLYINCSKCGLVVFGITREYFLGIISFSEFDPALPIGSSDLILGADLNDNIAALNQSLADFLKIKKPSDCFNAPVSTMVDFVINQDMPAVRHAVVLKPVSLNNASFTVLKKQEIKFKNTPALEWENIPSDSSRVVFMESPENFDSRDYRFSFTIHSPQKTFPSLLLRAEKGENPDLRGYVVGPDVLNQNIILKKGTYVIRQHPCPEIGSLPQRAFEIEKNGNQYIFRMDGVTVLSYTELFAFPPINESTIGFLLRPGVHCTVTNMKFLVSGPRPNPDINVIAGFKAMPQFKFKIRQQPCQFGSRNLIAYRFENITGLTNRIDRLEKEKSAVEQDRERIRGALENRETLNRFVGDNIRVKSIRDTLETLSQSASTLLLVGETGTGKEILAQTFHRLSPKAKGPFIKLDCATIPQTLLESELFGYEAGAFTGAHQRHAGKFEQAQGGTLFLDEISNLSIETQGKLLGVLEDFSITRIGGEKPRPLSLSVVAASNRDLDELMSENLFRQDLFYRLNRFKLAIPPLRERMDDLPGLCGHFLEMANREYRKNIEAISEKAYKRLYAHDWPGNVRELKNVIFKAILFSTKKTIQPEDIDITVSQGTGISVLDALSQKQRKSVRKIKLSKDEITDALARHKGNIFAVCDALKVSRPTIYSRMKKYQINPDIFRTP